MQPVGKGHMSEQPQKKASGLTIAGLVLAILGMVGSFVPLLNILSLVLVVLALIFGIIGMVKKEGGMAIAATVMSVIALIVTGGMYYAAGKVAEVVITDVADNWNVAGLELVGEASLDTSTNPAVVTGTIVNHMGKTVNLPVVTFKAFDAAGSELSFVCAGAYPGELAAEAEWNFSATCDNDQAVAPDHVELLGTTFMSSDLLERTDEPQTVPPMVEDSDEVPAMTLDNVQELEPSAQQ